ncbi:MAG: hypothetical protein E7388_01350 [Ruminococcaceae bacterium]|nr:hypothetical protein [Oscillospiraceae bacterium]
MIKRFLNLILILILLSVSISGCNIKPRDISADTPLAETVIYANKMSDKVQGFYNGESRSEYTLENSETILVNDLGDSKLTTLSNKKGKAYFEDTLDYFIKDKDGNIYYSSKSNHSGRINTLRLGYYYYESHVYDMSFNSDGAYKVTKSCDIGSFEKGDFVVSDNVEFKVDNKELVFSYEENSLTELFVEKTGLSVDIEKFPCLNFVIGGGAENFTFIPFFDGIKSNNIIEIQSGTPFNLKNFSEEGKLLTGYILSFTPKGTYTTISAKASENRAQPRAIALDKAAHFFSDKYHQEMHIVTHEAMNNLDSMGIEISISKSKVKKQISEKGYIGFDIKKVGILGFIIPSDNSIDKLEMIEGPDAYTLIISKVLPENVPNNFHEKFGIRIYTDDTHSFNGLINTANQERNPVTSIEIKGENKDNAEYLGYDYIRGMYRFNMDGSDFNEAYYETPNKYYEGYVSFLNNDLPRNAYVWFNTDNVCLESAVITDENNILQPVPLQVGKNFTGEGEEAFYLGGDPGYGDTIFPIKLDSNQQISFKLLNLYQNWGLTPLKQVSWIQFVCSYYHLSTGATESNCIAPYYFNGTINTLPDFRCRSGHMWGNQPQFNSVGVPSFVTSETYTGSKINSYGPTYADIEYSYRDIEDGLYQYSLRHVEFPQTDENRTYYTITLDFLKNGELDELPLAIFDSSDTFYDNFSYLDSENNEIEYDLKDLISKDGFTDSLSNEGGFVSLYNINYPETGTRGCNVSYIVKNISGKLNGKNYTEGVKFHVRLNNNDGSATFKILPDIDIIKFKKGDKLILDIVLLPWGAPDTEGNANTLKVRTDSVIKPADVEAHKGNVLADTWLPTVKCIENSAEFTLFGSDNNNAVSINGFTKLGCLKVEIKGENGQWNKYEIGTNEFDGYSVKYNSETGNYNYSFIWREPGTYRVSVI